MDLAAKLMVGPRTGIPTATVTVRSASEGIPKYRALFGVFDIWQNYQMLS